MIVIGVDVHKHSLTAVAVDEAGRIRDEKTVAAADEELLVWASGIDAEQSGDSRQTCAEADFAAMVSGLGRPLAR
jgi:predicted NBD/HSP70 family sugar kinase